MLNARIPALRNQALIGITLFALGLWVAWEVGDGKLWLPGLPIILSMRFFGTMAVMVGMDLGRHEIKVILSHAS
jgi:hypothetical protein